MDDWGRRGDGGWERCIDDEIQNKRRNEVKEGNRFKLIFIGSSIR